MKHGNENGLSRTDYRRLFDNVLAVYLDCISLPNSSACSYDGQAARRLAVGTAPLDYKIDVEIANRSVLTSPELREEWQRLLEDAFKATDATEGTKQEKKKPQSAEERELTNRVVMLCAKLYVKKNLDRVGPYFTRKRLRVE